MRGSDGRPPPPIDYAMPVARDPRPGVALWLAAAVVWTIALLVGVGGGFATLAFVVRGDVSDALIGIVAVALTLLAAYVEWRAVVGASIVATTLVWTSAAGLAMLLAVAVVRHLILTGVGSPGTGVIGLVAFMLYVGGPGFVAVTHALWAMRLRRSRREEIGGIDAA